MAKVTVLFMIALLVTGCGSDGSQIIIINTTGGDYENADFSACGVQIKLTFEDGEGRRVELDNQNDTTVIVHIDNLTDGSKTVRECLWEHTTSQTDTGFKVGDTLLLAVYLGEGQVWHWTCAQFVDEVLENFPLCKAMEISIQ